ncbi:MAG TPA: hypothetical protein VFP34_00265 [Microlunatus sp.]|nr:hypothetical protein [Microlunatus sp.]
MSLSFDHRIDSAAPFLDRTIRAYRDATVYAQDELIAQMVITGRESSPDWSGDARFPMQRSHRLYQDHRLVCNPTAWGWMEHLRANRFATGPRLHGTIAALLAGTPSLL